MKKKTSYQDMPVGELTRVKDFLPSPDHLAVPAQQVKVTLALKRSSVEFFKKAARQHHTKYQRMLRDLIDRYAEHYAVGR
jgi:predicted DNA binding CopG/RHH family protein